MNSVNHSKEKSHFGGLAQAGLLAGALILGTTQAIGGGVHGSGEIFVDSHGTTASFVGGNIMGKKAPGATLSVRIGGPDGEVVYQGHSKTGLVDWIPSTDLPDGQYSYDVWYVLETPAEKIAGYEDKEDPYHAIQVYKAGVFLIRGGVIEQPQAEEPAVNREMSAAPAAPSAFERLVGSILETMVPAAAAQDLFANDATPDVFIDDTDDGNSIITLRFRSDGLGNATGDTFSMDMAGNSFFHAEEGAPDNSIFIENTGDIGFRTSSPAFPLDISDDRPEIRLFDTTDGSGIQLEYNAGRVNIEGNTSQDIINYDATAPGNTMVIESNGDIGVQTTSPFAELTMNGTIGFENGTTPMMFLQETCCTGGDRMIVAHSPGGFDKWGLRYQESGDEFHFQTSDANRVMTIDLGGGVGIGTEDPDAALHVSRSTDAEIRVENTSGTTAERVLYRLVNNGKTRFAIINGGNSWTFDNAGTQFNISKVGTGANEFVVEDDGDGVFRARSFATQHINTSSRSAKTDFRAVDSLTMLEKVAALDVSQWRYKTESEDEIHVGPMAEDFQATFGLGDGRHISTVDAAGVALAAIKGLKAENDSKQERIEELEARIARLESMITGQE